MIYSKEFLQELDQQPLIEKYVKIIALDINEMPLEEIQGKVTSGGTISIDGASAVRRTCSLTFLADKEDTTITNDYWGLSHKFKLEIGISNNINSQYPNIIWINQGMYVISSFSKSESVNNYTITIQGKDKMALLNGELGGLFSASTTLDTIEIVNKDGSITYEKQLIHDIIKNMLHLYCNEPEKNIIINDLFETAYELWDYIGTGYDGKDMPLYYFRDANDSQNIKTYKQITNMTIDGSKIVYLSETGIISNGTTEIIKDDTYGTSFIKPDENFYTTFIGEDRFWTLQNISNSLTFKKVNNVFETGKKFKLSEKGDRLYFIQRLNFGETAGYHRTRLIYPTDLVANSGESITSILDKIKNLLGDFEYFYDTEGRFIFQKKKTYINNLFTPIIGNLVEPFIEVSQYSYEFNDKSLIASLSHSPNLSEVKNDFSIWGNLKSENDGDKLPILARYAIDKKPEKYITFPYYVKNYNYSFLKEQGVRCKLKAISTDLDPQTNKRYKGWPYNNEENWVKMSKTLPNGNIEYYYEAFGNIGDVKDNFNYSKEEKKYIEEEKDIMYALQESNIKNENSLEDFVIEYTQSFPNVSETLDELNIYQEAIKEHNNNLAALLEWQNQEIPWSYNEIDLGLNPGVLDPLGPKDPHNHNDQVTFIEQPQSPSLEDAFESMSDLIIGNDKNIDLFALIGNKQKEYAKKLYEDYKTNSWKSIRDKYAPEQEEELKEYTIASSWLIDTLNAIDKRLREINTRLGEIDDELEDLGNTTNVKIINNIEKVDILRANIYQQTGAKSVYPQNVGKTNPSVWYNAIYKINNPESFTVSGFKINGKGWWDCIGIFDTNPMTWSSNKYYSVKHNSWRNGPNNSSITIPAGCNGMYILFNTKNEADAEVMPTFGNFSIEDTAHTTAVNSLNEENSKLNNEAGSLGNDKKRINDWIDDNSNIIKDIEDLNNFILLLTQRINSNIDILKAWIKADNIKIDELTNTAQIQNKELLKTPIPNYEANTKYYIGKILNTSENNKEKMVISLIEENSLDNKFYTIELSVSSNDNKELPYLISGMKIIIKEVSKNQTQAEDGNILMTYTLQCGYYVDNQIYERIEAKKTFRPLSSDKLNQPYYIRLNDIYFTREANYILSNLEEPNLILDEIYYLKENSTTYVSLEYYNKLSETEKNKCKPVDWRELIWLMQRDYYQHNREKDFKIKLQKYNDLEFEGITGYEQYYADIQGFWRQLYDPEGNEEEYIKNNSIEATHGMLNWNRQVVYNPERLKFWFDFLDVPGPLSNYSVKKIGQRQKIDQANNNGVTAIFYRDIPEVEFVILPYENPNKLTTDYDKTLMYIQEHQRVLFNISSRGKDSSERADELFWKYACTNENVTITCKPIHSLEPNTRIKLLGEDYIINKITLPITHNGTMQITASKVINPI